MAKRPFGSQVWWASAILNEVTDRAVASCEGDAVDEFEVDPDALRAAAESLKNIGSLIGTARFDTSLSATPAGLPQTQTASAVSDLAVLFGAAVASYAAQTHGLASNAGANATDYVAVDDGAVEALRDRL